MGCVNLLSGGRYFALCSLKFGTQKASIVLHLKVELGAMVA